MINFNIRFDDPSCEKATEEKKKKLQRKEPRKEKNPNKFRYHFMYFFSLISVMYYKIFPNTLSYITNVIRILRMNLRYDPLAAITLSNMTCEVKFFFDSEVPKGRYTLMAYQLCAEKTTDLVGNFRETSPAATWGEL